MTECCAYHNTQCPSSQRCAVWGFCWAEGPDGESCTLKFQKRGDLFWEMIVHWCFDAHTWLCAEVERKRGLPDCSLQPADLPVWFACSDRGAYVAIHCWVRDIGGEGR